MGWLVLKIISALGINPASWIASALKTLAICLPFLLSAGLVVGAYFYGVGAGKSECNAAYLQTVINGKDLEIKSLKDQAKDYMATITGLNTRNKLLEGKVKDAKGRVVTVVKDLRECDQGKPLVDLLNGVRSGQ